MLISLIVPAFNAEAYVSRCMASIFNNAPSEDVFEVIVINDGSQDKTSDVVKKCCFNHSNVKLIDKVNEGVSVARNVGIRAAQGEYVLFLDIDDELVEGSLSKVCSYLSEHEPVDMLMTRQLRNNGKQERLTAAPSLIEHKIYNGVEAYKSHFVRVNAGGGICRREFLLHYNLTFPEGVRNAEDTIFFGHLQVYANSIVYYNLPLYRINEANASASRNNDYSKLAKSHVITLQSVAEVKKSLNASFEQKAIFDFVVYQLLSNTIAFFSLSKDLKYKQFRKEVNTRSLLPLDTRNMYLMKNKAILLNLSVSFFYFLSWLKHKF